MKVIRATKEHLSILVPLLDGYRVFYKQPSDTVAGKEFLEQRFDHNDSVIFLAINSNDQGVGFTQLYPSFSTVSMQRVYILNDLFVHADHRGQGIGERLMEHAKEFARSTQSKGLTLETAIDNPAQHLYERLGWVKDSEVFHYTWKV